MPSKKAPPKAMSKAARKAPSRRPPVKPIRIPHKDPSVAVLISVVGLLFAAPAAGYFYLHQTRKGVLYLLATWILVAVVITIGTLVGFVTNGLGFICFPPLGLVILVCEAFIIYDVYLTASHQTPKLPTF